MVFPPIHPAMSLGGEEEFLADFISYLVNVDPESAGANDEEAAVRYEKINSGDTVVNLRPELGITGIKSLEKDDGTDYTFPNKDVIVVVRIKREAANATTAVFRASTTANTADGDILKTQAIRVNQGFYTLRFSGNKNGKFLTVVESATGEFKVTTAFVIESA